MTVRLPSKLTKIEPVIAAAFEVRCLPAAAPLLQLLPALMFGKFGADVRIESINQGLIHENPFDPDANFFVPRIRLSWNGIEVMVGERVIGCAVEAKYIGGEEFESRIHAVFEMCFDGGALERVTRYSYKYVNFFPAEGEINIPADLDCSIRIGSRQVEKAEVNLQIESTSDIGFRTVLKFASRAFVKGLKFEQALGGVIESDFICLTPPTDLSHFREQFDTRLTEVRTGAKAAFFDCFDKKLIDEKMGAIYVSDLH